MSNTMAELRRRLPRTRCDFDRHGNERWYAIDPHGQKVRLNPPKLDIGVGSDAFMARYKAALSGDLSNKPPRTSKLVPGSIGELINLFLHDPSSSYNTAMQKRSQYVLKGRLLRIQKEHGDRSAEGLTVEVIKAGRDSKRDTPWAANNRILALRSLYAYAEDKNLVSSNPAAKVKLIKTKSKGYHSWTREEIAQFEAHWTVGTMARFAFDLLRYTGQRRGDIIRLGPQHVSAEGRLMIRQRKTDVELEIPIVGPLADSIASMRHDHLTFIVTAYGKPFSDAGFGNKFRGWCDAAGLPNCTAHGLRKALAAQLADYGLTTNEIAAVTGHKTLREIQRYTDAADQKRMADKAMRTYEAQIVPLSSAHLKKVGGKRK